jgi:hypothetical protein
MLHPDGLYAEQGLGPGDALKRAAKLHSTLTHRRSQSLARLDALLELLGPAWHTAIGADLANRTPLKFLAAGYTDPHVVKRLGRTRLARFCYRHSRGAWGEPHADALLAAANQTLELWSGGELDYPDLAEDIALEARLALQLTEEIKDLDERTRCCCVKPTRQESSPRHPVSRPSPPPPSSDGSATRTGSPHWLGPEPSPAWFRSSTPPA